VQDRTVLLLVDLVGLGYEEAAEILKVPRGTVASRLNAARTRMREALDA
jgi:RNA polymerase sigma-70 factor, ECF subfamily